MQSLKPWCSSEDIAKGARGGHEIAQKLGEVNFGIVCLTPSNLHNEWIHFESGALSKNLDNSALYTILLDLQPSDVKPPLGHFQHTRIFKEELLKLAQAINSKTDKPLTSEVLRASFDAFWPKLQADLSALPVDSSPLPTSRPEREILEEILSVVRGQGREDESSKKADIRMRRAIALISFAEGIVTARKVEGTVSGRLTPNGMAFLSMNLQGKDHNLELSTEDLPESKKIVSDFIVANTFSKEDIPF